MQSNLAEDTSATPVAVDAMGGDSGVSLSVPAVRRALFLCPDLRIFLTGGSAISDALRKSRLSGDPRVTVVEADSEIESDSDPIDDLKNSAGTSMRAAVELVKSGKAGACVSGGNTGALVAISRYLLRTLSGVEHPALVTCIPSLGNSSGRSVMLDLGANLHSSERDLVEYARFGSLYAHHILKISEPNVKILNVGTEFSKGRKEIRAAAEELSSDSSVRFTGFMEGSELFSSDADVIVTDGFSGNIALKTAEGFARTLFKSHSGRSPIAKLMSLPLKWLLGRRLRIFSPDRYNGAALLGLSGIVVKSHGAAGVEAFANSILAARDLVRSGIMPALIKSTAEPSN